MKFIVWGLPLHSHTHSYIHHAFARVSKHLGYETHWVPDEEPSNNALTPGSVVLSCGVADTNLRSVEGVQYILHNSARDDLRENKHINLQVYTHDVLERDTESLGDLTFWESSTKTLYQPWGTDLLPDEVLAQEPTSSSSAKKDVYWVGSVTNGEHGNIDMLQRYAELCAPLGVKVSVKQNVSVRDAIDLTRSSRHAPTIASWSDDGEGALTAEPHQA